MASPTSIALVSPPTQTNAGSDTVISLASGANHFLIQNNTSVSVYVAFDAVASTSSLVLVPGTTYRDDIPVSTIHLFTVAAQPINAATGIIVGAWD